MFPLNSGMLSDNPKYKVPRANHAKLIMIVFLRIIGVLNKSMNVAFTLLSSAIWGIITSSLIPFIFIICVMASLHSLTLPVGVLQWIPYLNVHRAQEGFAFINPFCKDSCIPYIKFWNGEVDNKQLKQESVTYQQFENLILTDNFYLWSQKKTRKLKSPSLLFT